MSVHNPVNPRVQAAGAALGAYIDQLGIRRDVAYLVHNGIEVNDAVNRIVTYRRKSMIWGLCAVPTLFWSGTFVGFGIYRALPGLALGRVLDMFLGGAFISLGLVMGYLLVMSQFWLWRSTCRGIPWEDSRNRWFPSLRPKHLRISVPGEPGDGGRKLAAVLVATIATLSWLVPVAGGTLSALATILGGSQ